MRVAILLLSLSSLFIASTMPATTLLTTKAATTAAATTKAATTAAATTKAATTAAATTKAATTAAATTKAATTAAATTKAATTAAATTKAATTAAATTAAATTKSATTASATTASATTTSATTYDSYMTKVVGYISSGTCGSVSYNTKCGTNGTSYYKSFTYNGKRVVIVSGIPNHVAETDQKKPNPNTRCERWQFISVPINPTKATTTSDTPMGAIGLAVTGGVFYNHLSSTDGSLALTNEGTTLDSCFGHSDANKGYHYHANINCTSAGSATGANNASACVLLAYYRDGVPLYGFCKNSSGVQFTSCYKLSSTATTTTVSLTGGTYNVGYYESSYYYDTAAFNAGTCNLDKANGAIHPTTGQYSYFTTYGYPWVPIYYYGGSGIGNVCSAA